MNDAQTQFARHLATGFGLGERLPAPGTVVGSLPAALLWWLMCTTVAAPSLQLLLTAVAMLAAAGLGVWAAELEAERLAVRDPGAVVIDEVAGQWLAFLVAMPFVGPLTGTPLLLFTGIGFLLFRLFDIAKPWPLRRLEEFPGGLGIVADDLAAGYYAAVVLVIGWTLLA